MAKKKTTSTGSSTTLSTRFDAAELDILHRAAEQKKWSLAQLIRAGAYEKSVNIVNSAGEALDAVRGIAGKVAEHLIRPTMKLEWWDGPPTETRLEATRIERKDIEYSVPDVIWGAELDNDTLVGFLQAVMGLGSELAPLLANEVRRVRANKSSLDSLLDPFSPPAKAAQKPEDKPEPAKVPKTKTKARKGGRKKALRTARKIGLFQDPESLKLVAELHAKEAAQEAQRIKEEEAERVRKIKAIADKGSI